MTSALEEAANWVLDNAIVALTPPDPPGDSTLPGPPDVKARRVHFGAGDGGQIPFDRCCDGGQLVVLVGTVRPTVSFPRPLTDPVTCAVSWMVPVAVEIARCFPTPNNRGTLDYIEAQAKTELRLDEAMALACHFASVSTRRQAAGYQLVIQGVNAKEDGGCMAVRLAMMLHLR